MQPVDMQVVGRELAVKWSDGGEDFVPLKTLRRFCPCAACLGEKDIFGKTYRAPERPYGAGAFAVARVLPVGGYAIQIVWGDGHNTGLYTWEWIKRVAAAKGVDLVCVATTTEQRDDQVVTLAEAAGAVTFRGSENDVLSRYAGAARQYGADLVVRVTSDCPLFDPGTLSGILAAFHRDSVTMRVDHYSNCLDRTFPRGLDVEVFPAAVLFRLDEEAKDIRAREHVTWELYQHPDKYRLRNYADPGGRDRSDLRWTVDTEADYQMVQHVYDALAPVDPLFGYEETLRYVELHPEISAINAHIEQKKI